MCIQAVILAAGIGTRLGKPYPKPLTPLRSGETINERQLRNLRQVFGEHMDITMVVGFKLELIMEAAPTVRFVYNELFDQTNTSKSLLKALQLSTPGGVLWMNGDVVFDAAILGDVRDRINRDQSFVCVNTASVADEEVKYTLDDEGYIAELSKEVGDGLGEAVGINYVASADKPDLIRRLAMCDAQDYFERGIELAITKDGQRWLAPDISRYRCVEVDFQADLELANSLLEGDGGEAIRP